MSGFVFSVLVLGLTGVLAALILYFVAERFKVDEDPKINLILDALPGGNCGGCGYAGCRVFAETIVKNESLEGMICPAGGDEVLAEIGKLMGLEADETIPQIAVVRCNGGKLNTDSKVGYDGVEDCYYANLVFSSEGGCPNSCLGFGNCVDVCLFDAIYIDPITGLPVVDEEKCVACGACVKECPRKIIELRNKGRRNMRIFVSCVNTEKGGVARRNCKVACIGCGKCKQACKFDAITLENNLAYIDYEKCKLCRKCVEVCPTGSIWEVNFPERKPKKEEETEVLEAN